jgi:hypothetical protein
MRETGYSFSRMRHPDAGTGSALKVPALLFGDH